MKKQSFLIGVALACFAISIQAGDSTCYGYTSTTSHFACNIAPHNSGNCVWWAAYKRPDLAEAIEKSGVSGWNGGQWTDKLKNMGFSVGSVPKEGAVVEFSSPGHVAHVKQVNSDGSFDASEMDAYGSEGFSPGVNYATYYPIGGGKYHRNGGSTEWTLKSFIYDTRRSYEVTLYRSGSVGWYPRVDICGDADYWYHLTEENGKLVAHPVNKSVCDEVPRMCYAQ